MTAGTWRGSASVQTPSAMRPAISAACSPKRSEEHTSELQSQFQLVCRLLFEKKNTVSLDCTTVRHFEFAIFWTVNPNPRLRFSMTHNFALGVAMSPQELCVCPLSSHLIGLCI